MNRTEAIELMKTVAAAEAEQHDWVRERISADAIELRDESGRGCATVRLSPAMQRGEWAVLLIYAEHLDADNDWVFTSDDTCFPI